MTPYEEQRDKIRQNTNASMFARDSYSSRVTPIKPDPTYRGFNDPNSFNPDLDTPDGLYRLANRAGLGQQADKMVKDSGGESQKFMSGGFLMDAMDILNAGSYGVVGMVKGKGFVDGVKNRESLSDDDALGKYGWSGKVAGFLLDIALDPLTYVAPWKTVSKIPGVIKGADYAKTALLGELKTIEIGGQKMFSRQGGYSITKLLPQKLVYGFAVDRTYLDGMQKIIGRNEAVAGDMDELVGTLAKADKGMFKDTLSKSPDGRIISKDLSELQRTYSAKELEGIKQMYDTRDALMKRLTDLGVISKETADEHWGTYLKQTYDEFLESKEKIPGKGGIGVNSPKRVEGLTPEKMKELGQVEDPGVIWGTTLLKQIDLVKKAELQKFVSESYSITKDQIDEYLSKGGKMEDLHAVSDSSAYKRKGLDELGENKMGQLAGKYVPKDLWDTLKQTFEPTREVGQSLVLPFKHAKVIWNPASHARNAVSATIQNWWKLGIGPWRVDMYYDAAKEIKDKNGKIMTEMRELGFNERSGQIQELVENYLSGKHIKDSLASQYGKGSKAYKAFKHADKFLVNSYGHMDNVAKVAAYKYGIKNGLSKEDALKKAYEATFNYSEVTPFVHSMRRAIWGVPFITFSLKAAPLVASTLANAPGRISVFGKARNDLFKAAGIEGEQESEAMPDYMRDDMFVMRLPWKDGEGRSMYFDMSYIIPFGSIMNGDYLKNPIGSNPILQLVKELSQNKTFGGGKIFNETDDIDTVLGDIFVHTGKLYLPPLVADQFPDGYNSDGTRKWKGYSKFMTQDSQDKGPGERSFYQELFRTMGAGVSPYDLDSKERQLAYKQKENLTKLLVENDVMKEFRSPYLPKDSELKEPQNLYDSRPTPMIR